jgi:magnesium-protoporphyrin O-methyltransferase
MMPIATYDKRRGELETYFDRTAVEAWKRLTSDAPVSGIRATVRAGRDAMRATLLSWLPEDLSGRRILDAGCGTGALAVEAARRGADVLAIDISPKLVEIARDRVPDDVPTGRIDFRAGDMLSPELGRFDHVVAMDSLIHYEAHDIVRMLAALADRTTTSMVVTVAPRTPLLVAMQMAGKLFPRGDRSPAIVPTSMFDMRRRIAMEPAMAGWAMQQTKRVSTSFYISAALEVART